MRAVADLDGCPAGDVGLALLRQRASHLQVGLIGREVVLVAAQGLPHHLAGVGMPQAGDLRVDEPTVPFRQADVASRVAHGTRLCLLSGFDNHGGGLVDFGLRPVQPMEAAAGGPNQAQPSARSNGHDFRAHAIRFPPSFARCPGPLSTRPLGWTAAMLPRPAACKVSASAARAARVVSLAASSAAGSPAAFGSTACGASTAASLGGFGRPGIPWRHRTRGRLQAMRPAKCSRRCPLAPAHALPQLSCHSRWWRNGG